jgi:hypothetical protein
VTAEPLEQPDWRDTLDSLLEHPATWRHIAVTAELASRRHPDGWATKTALRSLAWAAADLAYLTAGELPPETVLTTTPDTHTAWDGPTQEQRAAKRAESAWKRGARGQLTRREQAALADYYRASRALRLATRTSAEEDDAVRHRAHAPS